MLKINMCFMDVEKNKIKLRNAKTVDLDRKTEEIVIKLEGKDIQKER